MTTGWSSRSGPGAVLGAGIAVISPFDLARPSEGWTSLHLRPLLLLTASLALMVLFVGRSLIEGPAVVGPLALVAGFAIASLASPDLGTGFAVTVRVAVLGLVFAAATVAYRTPSDVRVLVIGAAIGSGLAAVIGLTVLINGADLLGTGELLGSISVSRGVTRLTRPFSHANVAAMYLAPAVVLVAGGAIGVGSRLGRGALVGASVVASVALALTLSRGGLAGLLVGAGALAVAGARTHRGVGARHGRAGGAGPSMLTVGLPVGLVAMATAVVVLSGRLDPRLDAAASSATSNGGPPPLTRPTIWHQAIDAALEHPLVGVGPGRFGVHSRSVTPVGEAAAAHAHNPVLEAAATGGAVVLAGLAVFGIIIVARAAPGLGSVPFGLSAALGAAMLPMVADNPFLFSSSGNLVALIGGAWYGAARTVPA